MRLLALDLSLASTGWALLRDGVPSEYGVMETRASESDAERIGRLADQLVGLIQRFRPNRMAIEATDWMPGASGSREDWVREARARYALGMAYGAAIASMRNVIWIEALETIGANEWRGEFGAHDKAGVAILLAAEFPKLFTVERSRLSLRVLTAPPGARLVTRAGEVLPDHVSDAMGLGYVAYRRFLQAQKIEAAERTALHA